MRQVGYLLELYRDARSLEYEINETMQKHSKQYKKHRKSCVTDLNCKFYSDIQFL